jgi:site-specific DNA-methyltransferase (adenine-specific)
MTYPDDFINQVIQGDCLEVMKHIPDKSIDLVLTDPPYSAGIDKTFNDDITEIKKLNTIQGNYKLIVFTSPSKVSYVIQNIEADFLRMFWWYKPNDIAHCWHGFQMVSECILIFKKGEVKFPKVKGAIHDTFIKCNEKGLHPCAKPISIIGSLIERFSFPNDLILDPFLGSGTTAVACKRLNRRFIGIEISEKYCQIARDRLNNEAEPLFKEPLFK